MKTIEFDEQCKSCAGSGLYSGMAERDGFAVVCSTCKGTGCHHFVYNYEEFAGRIEDGIAIQVVEANPGIMLGMSKGIASSRESFGGMSYLDWKNGHPFPPKSEMRNFTCPAWWYQSTDYDKKPNWKECHGNLGRSFSKCNYFSQKEACWERFDQENR